MGNAHKSKRKNKGNNKKDKGKNDDKTNIETYKSLKDRKSNFPVKDLPLEPNNPKFTYIPDDNDIESLNDIKYNTNLPIENEIGEEKYFGDDEEYETNNNFFLLDCEAPPVFDPNLLNAPNQKIKMFDGHITPLKLYSKTFGRTKWKYKKLNPIISDYEKSKKDSKSCNDYKNSADDNFNEIYSEHDTERTTPSLEDFKNLQKCRKKMAIFRDSIGNKSDHSLKDNGKVEYIFSGNKEMYNKEYKKDKFWKKHINLQLKHKSNDLFILGILESAAKEKKNKKKHRNTTKY